MPVADPAALPSPAQCHRQGPALNWPAGCGDRDPQRHVHHCGSNKTLNTGSSEINAFLVQVSAFSFCRINTYTRWAAAGRWRGQDRLRTEECPDAGPLRTERGPLQEGFPPFTELWMLSSWNAVFTSCSVSLITLLSLLFLSLYFHICEEFAASYTVFRGSIPNCPDFWHWFQIWGCSQNHL